MKIQTIMTDLDETRTTPLVLSSGTTIRGGRICLGSTFAGTGLITLAPGAQDICIENLEVVGWEDMAPYVDLPYFYPLRGLELQGGVGITVRGCSVRYFVGEACYFRNCRDVEVYGCSFDRSLFGLMFDWSTQPSCNVIVRDVTVVSTRGVANHLDGGPSFYYPGQIMGGDCIVVHGWTNVRISDVRTAGEFFGGVKIVTCDDIILSDSEIAASMPTGACYYDSSTKIATQPPGYVGPLIMGSFLIKNCRLDPDLATRGEGQLLQVTPLQVSFPSTIPVRVEDCTIFAPRQGYLRSNPDQPQWRHAPIQVATDASLVLRNTRFLDREINSIVPNWVQLAGGTCDERGSTYTRCEITGGVNR